MTANVRKVFDILGIEPNEKFKLKSTAIGISYGDFYKIDKNLDIFFETDSSWKEAPIGIKDLLNETYAIIGLKKKKLRDLTEEAYKEWYKNNCTGGNCGKCPFATVNCYADSEYCWVNHKDLYWNKFLDQEIEVEE